MFHPTHTFHGIPVQILARNESGTVRVQSRNTINDGNMGPETLNPPYNVLSEEWLHAIARGL